MILGDFQHGKERGLIFQHDDGSYSFAVDVTCRHVGVDPLDENSTLLHIQWPTLDGIQNLAMLAQDMTSCMDEVIVRELEGTPDA